MSQSFDVRLETNLTAEQVLKILAGELKGQVESGNQRNSFRVPETAVSVVGNDYMSDAGKNLMRQSYGFLHNLAISFADYTGKVPQSQQDNRIGKGIASIFKNVKGNAVLLYNGEETIAQRINEKLVLQKENYDWLTDALDQAGLKYERKPLKSPFLE